MWFFPPRRYRMPAKKFRKDEYRRKPRQREQKVGNNTFSQIVRPYPKLLKRPAFLNHDSCGEGRNNQKYEQPSPPGIAPVKRSTIGTTNRRKIWSTEVRYIIYSSSVYPVTSMRKNHCSCDDRVQRDCVAFIIRKYAPSLLQVLAGYAVTFLSTAADRSRFLKILHAPLRLVH